MRVAIGLQIGFLTAAAAALILEKSGTKIYDTTTFSIARALNSGPSSIGLAALGQFTTGSFIGRLSCLIVLGALVVAWLSTFISTLLLSDFRTSRIAAPITTTNLGIGLDLDRDIETFASYWKSRPASNWRFAETKIGSPPSIDGIVDTGDVYRALLALVEAESRTSLEYYSGPAIVTNFRTACIAPVFEHLKLNYSYFNNARIEGIFLEATLRFGILEENSLQSGMFMSYPIECKLHNQWNPLNRGAHSREVDWIIYSFWLSRCASPACCYYDGALWVSGQGIFSGQFVAGSRSDGVSRH